MSLLDAVVEAVRPTEVPEEAESPKEEITLDGFIQLQIALRDRQIADSKPVEDEIASIETKMATEQAIVDAYQSFDVAEAAKADDFDRSSAATMAANAEVSSQILAGLETDMYAARQKLSDISREYGRLNTMLNSHADQMNTTRKAVCIEWIKGGSKLQIDRDHARRWLNVFVAARTWMERTFGPEQQEAVDYCIAQLSAYDVPKPTDALYTHLTERDREQYPQFKPQGAQ